MTRLAPLAALLACLAAGASPIYGQDVARAPEGQVVPTRDELVTALVQIGDERDGLRKALRSAQDEIARLRAVQDDTLAEWSSCQDDLQRSLDLGETLLRSHAAMSSLLSKERGAATRARWLDRLGCSLGYGGVIGAESGYGFGGLCGVRIFP